eukprot:1256187-Rhodomonas_salina.1
MLCWAGARRVRQCDLEHERDFLHAWGVACDFWHARGRWECDCGGGAGCGGLRRHWTRGPTRAEPPALRSPSPPAPSLSIDPKSSDPRS